MAFATAGEEFSDWGVVLSGHPAADDAAYIDAAELGLDCTGLGVTRRVTEVARPDRA